MTALRHGWDLLRSSLWFIPALMTALAIALGFWLLSLDRMLGPGGPDRLWLYPGGPEGARGVLTAIAGSMVTVEPKGETRRITVPITKANVEKYGLFEHKEKAVSGRPREWRATELLGDYLSLKDIEDYGSVTDLMFDRQGRLRGIAASPEIDSPVVRFYAPFSGNDAGWDPGDDYYVLPYSAEEIEKLLPERAS